MTDSEPVNGANNAPPKAAPPYISMKTNPVAILHSKFGKLTAKTKDNFDFEPCIKSSCNERIFDCSSCSIASSFVRILRTSME